MSRLSMPLNSGKIWTILCCGETKRFVCSGSIPRMPKLRRGSQPTPHDVPISCRANGQNYESVTSLRTRRANPARFRSIRVARGLRCLSLLWERGGGAQYVGACQGVCVAAGWGPDGRRGRRDGEGAEGFRGESLCVVAEWLLGLVWGGQDRGCFGRKQRSVIMRGVVGRKQKEDRSRQVDMPGAAAVLAHPKIITRSGRFRGPLCTAEVASLRKPRRFFRNT